MSIRITTIAEHRDQLSNPEIMAEINSAQLIIDKAEKYLSGNSVNLVSIGGYYRHAERSITVACVLINNLGYPISGISCKLGFRLSNCNAQIATVMVDLKQQQMGIINDCEGVLLHIIVPVAGLKKDQFFDGHDINDSILYVDVEPVITE